jgi:hypothetical protein
LLVQALAPPQIRFRIEAFNVCDEGCGTFREILTMAHRGTWDPSYLVSAGLPMAILADFTKEY